MRIVAIDVGNRSLGILRNALFAMPLKAASWFPAAHCLMGFKAQTYPVTSENIDTPIRPCTSIRTIGYWRNRGAACSWDVGLKRSSSKARARCVKTTRRDAIPRRPYDQVIMLVEAFLRAGIVEGDWGRGFRRKRQGVTYIYPFHVFLSDAHSASTNLYREIVHFHQTKGSRENVLSREVA